MLLPACKKLGGADRGTVSSLARTGQPAFRAQILAVVRGRNLRQSGVIGALTLGLTACSLDVAVTLKDGGGGADTGEAPTCTLQPWMSRGYVFCDALLSWQDAQDHCAQAGWRLVRMDSVEENDWVRATSVLELGLTSNAQLWLGATDAAEEGLWRWTDKTVFSVQGKPEGGLYSSWATGMPRAGDALANCALMVPASGPGWSDADCALPSAFVCEDY